jgi:hypothetical protein
VEVWLEFDNTNHRALTIPLQTCTHFAIFPLTWLRHLGFTICGSQGHISDTPNGQAIANYRPTPVIQPGIYYYITGGESYFASLDPLSPLLLEPRWLDIDMMNDRDSYTSARTARRADFRQDLIDRDGTCVITGATPGNSRACHVVPHSRGDEVCPNISWSFQAYSSPSILSISLNTGRSQPWRASMTHGTDCCFILVFIIHLGSFGSHFCESVISCIPIVFAGLNSFLDS